MLGNLKSVYYGTVAFCVAIGGVLESDNRFRHCKDDLYGLLRDLEGEQKRARSRRNIDSQLFAHSDLSRANDLERRLKEKLIDLGGIGAAENLLKKQIPLVDSHIAALTNILRGKIANMLGDHVTEGDKLFAKQVNALIDKVGDLRENIHRAMDKKTTLDELGKLYVARQYIKDLVIAASDYGHTQRQFHYAEIADEFDKAFNPLRWIRDFFKRG